MKKQVLIALCAVCITQLSAQLTPEQRQLTPEQRAQSYKEWNADLDEQRQEGIISQQEYEKLKMTEEEPPPESPTIGETHG